MVLMRDAARHGRRERRLEQFRRAGVPAPGFSTRFAPSASFASPVTLAESRAPATLVAEIEHFGIPAGTIFDTGDAADGSVLSVTGGSLELQVTSNSVLEINVSLLLPVTGTGFHTYALALDPAYTALIGGVPHDVIRAVLFLDGRVVIEALGTTQDSAVAAWASSTATWAYAQLTNVGSIGQGELHRGALPGVF